GTSPVGTGGCGASPGCKASFDAAGARPARPVGAIVVPRTDAFILRNVARTIAHDCPDRMVVLWRERALRVGCGFRSCLPAWLGRDKVVFFPITSSETSAYLITMEVIESDQRQNSTAWLAQPHSLFDQLPEETSMAVGLVSTRC